MKIILNRSELEHALAKFYGAVPRGYVIREVDVNQYRGDEFCVIYLEEPPADLTAYDDINNVIQAAA